MGCHDVSYFNFVPFLKIILHFFNFQKLKLLCYIRGYRCHASLKLNFVPLLNWILEMSISHFKNGTTLPHALYTLCDKEKHFWSLTNAKIIFRRGTKSLNIVTPYPFISPPSVTKIRVSWKAMDFYERPRMFFVKKSMRFLIKWPTEFFVKAPLRDFWIGT